MRPVPDLFITGTDTGVGKSMVSLLLMQLFFSRGYAPFYLKPFQTGCSGPCSVGSDAKFIYDHTPALKDRDPAQSVIYCHPEPKAPFFAAAKAGDEIDLATVQKVVKAKRERHSPLVIEGAGGPLVPVTDKVMVVDLIKDLGCRPILVARAGLGTINHSLLCIEAMRRRQIDPLGVVFVDCGAVPANSDLVAENIRAVETFGGVKVGGVIGHLPDLNRIPASDVAALEKILD